MGDSVKCNGGGSRFLNPWVLHFQKLALELKCPLCLNLFNRPMLFPCNHIFCSSCIPISTQFQSECAICKSQHFNKDLRPAPFMENLVTIYRSLDATFSANLFKVAASDSGRVLEQRQASFNANFDQLSKGPFETTREDNSYGRQSIFSLTGNKRVQFPLSLNHSDEDGVGKNDKFDNYSMPSDGKGRKFEIDSRGGEKLNGAGSLNPSPPSAQMGPGGLEECRAVEIDMNQVAQMMPESPPSSVDAKSSDHDSSEHGLGNSSIKRAINKNSEDRTRQLRHDTSASETEDDHLRDAKRQKKLNYGSSDLITNRDDCIQPVVSHSGISATPNSELELTSRIPPAAVQQPVISDDSFVIECICAFCQSSKVSEATGPMLHYANGEDMVVGDEATLANVVHVHKLCIDWAPQVYFDNETAKNLKMEVARGKKFKCSKCGKRGAVLGCYLKSCRKSYHYPCLKEISDCRWDDENFLVYCPAHASRKFPKEKTKSGKHILMDHVPIQKTPQESNLWVCPPKEAKELVFCGSALSTEEKFLMVKFASLCGATVTKFWKPNVTHVIAATDAQGACTRTLKVLMAILNGRWVLNIGWIRACMEAKHPLDEEPYEVTLDNHGCRDGPRTGRIMALDNAPKLFNGLNFYFSGDFVPGYKEDFQNLVIAAGASVLRSKEEVVAQNYDNLAASRVLVVYNLEAPHGCKVGEEVSILWKRLTEAQDVASSIGSQVIGHAWLLESIAACKLQPFVS